MLTVKCPRCKHDMLYDPRFAAQQRVVGKKKRCIYCGRSFSIHADLSRTRIVAVGKADSFNVPW